MSSDPYERSARYYDLFYEQIRDYEAECNELIASIEEFAPSARSLLDVGCGTGQHLLRLARRFEVAGADTSPAMIAIARERVPGVSIEVCDVGTLDLGRRFDVVTFLFSGIAYLQTPERIAAAIGRITAHLEPGGIAIIDAWLSPDALDPARMIAGMTVEGDGMVVSRVDHLEVVGSLSVLTMHHAVGTPAGIEHFTEHHKLGLLPRSDYEDAFASAGMEILAVRDAFEGRDRFIARC